MKKQAKTIIFLNTVSQLAFYDWSTVMHLDEYRCVVILGEGEKQHLNPGLVPYFDEVIEVATHYDATKTYFELNEAAVVKVVQQELECLGNANLLRLVTIHEVNVLLAAKLRDQFGIPGMNFDTALLFRDKILMKQRLIGSNVRVPIFFPLSETQLEVAPTQYFQECVEKLQLPFIIKQSCLLGSTDIWRISSAADFDIFCQKRAKGTIYEAEEMIQGTLVHSDSVVKNGKIIFSESSECLHPTLTFMEGKVSASVPIAQNNPLKTKINQFTTEVLTLFGMPDGCSHLELFIDPQGDLVFLEIGARPPGSFVIDSYKSNFGVNLANLDLEVALLDDILPLKYQIESYSMFAVFPAQNGTVHKLYPPSLQSQYTQHWFVKGGDKVRQQQTITKPVMALFAQNKDYNSLYQDFKSLDQYQPIDYK